ncbi:MAG: N-acetyltransferase [Dehalococcoidales bacterium]|nr:N-acetyltransferase [Dehalococcoidales bacterium]
MAETTDGARALAIRRATIRDVTQIQQLVNGLAETGALLPRALSELYENLRDYYVVADEERVVACCALHICWEDLAEVRSLAVDGAHQGQQLGRGLVQRCLEEAELLGLATVFTLTRKPEFFEHCGFWRVDVAELPRKIWGECFRCPKFPNCDEVALIHKMGSEANAPQPEESSIAPWATNGG